MIDFLFEKKFCDNFIFWFNWVVFKERFYSCFDQIYIIFKDSETFWADLWNLILE